MKKTICNCGCGKEFDTKWLPNKKRFKMYLRGHQDWKKFSETVKTGYKEGKRINWMKGKHHSEETKNKLRKPHLWATGENSSSKRPEVRLKQSLVKLGEKNPLWKGDDVKYNALHDYIKSHKPKSDYCGNCNKKTSTDLANISGSYKRDITDYKWLCRRCHMISDGRMDNLILRNKLKR